MKVGKMIMGALAMAATNVPAHAAPGGAVVRGPVHVQSPASRNVATLPQVIPGAAVASPIAAKINAALNREDLRAVKAASECRASYREMQGKASPDAWTREVTVTMAGPHYLAYQVSDSYYCGGPYPNDGIRSAFVYDLDTGRPVDWLALFPTGAIAQSASSASGATLGIVAWRELSRRAAADAPEECRDVFGQDERTGFTIGLDARSGELTALPTDLPHAIQACAEEVRINTADLRRLGFSPRLIDALQAARQQQRSAR